MKEKIIWLRDPKDVTYGPVHWALLEALRESAETIGSALGAGWAVHGSIARGDVKKTSDIDLILTGGTASYEVELKLEGAEIPWLRREVVMATPNSTPKGHIQIAENITVTFPLAGFRTQEEDFYKFGGMLPVEGLAKAGRVPGVTKKLLLIIPTDIGHSESAIVGREAEVARLLGISPEVVMERIRVLSRRDTIGRTGVYLREEVPDSETFEETLKHLADRDPVVRRTVKNRQ